MDDFIYELKLNQKLNDYQRNFLEYIKGKDEKVKAYVVQKFSSFLKIEIPDNLQISTDFELCEIKTQKFINYFIDNVKDDNQIKEYLQDRKYIQMSLIEKLVVYVVLNDMIKDDNIYKYISNKGDVIKQFKDLVSKCKFKSHKGFLD